jgi:glycosyltransferase involved in cell wall biosynthesis
MAGQHSHNISKFFIVVFDATTENNNAFLRLRHKIDENMFSALEKNYAVTFLKLKEAGIVIHGQEKNELFFTGRNKFFHVPFKLLTYIKQQQPPVIFIHGFVFPFQTLALRCFISRQTKIIVQHHAEKPFENRIKRWLQQLAYAGADAYLFTSAELARAYCDRKIIKDANKIHEVMETSTLFTKKDKQAARAHLQINADTVFLWVGRLDRNKDPFTALHAFKRYRETGASFKLYMLYGATDLEEEIKTFIAAHDLSQHIQLIGAVKHEALETWYSAADYFVSASHYEGGGIAFCEAMACGCIPIVTKIPSFVKMTGDVAGGLLFEPGNSDMLFKILCTLDASAKEKISEAVVRQFQLELSFDAIGKRIKEISEALAQQ